MKTYARVFWLPTLGIATATNPLGPSTAIRAQGVESTGFTASFVGFITATLQSGWNLTQEAGPMLLAIAGLLLVAIGTKKRKSSDEIAD